MFTLPDGPDALTAVPAFPAPGPHPSGFYADCNVNPPGTIPVAEDFNELIVNLRALLAKAQVTPVKGDATMLWRAIFQLQTISTHVNLYVTPTGTANPVNPWGGDPFGHVADALAFLASYRITPAGYVVINVAAGTYVMPGQLVLDHPSGARIAIVGAGPTATLLQCPALSAWQGAIVLGSGAFSFIQQLGLIGPGWTGSGKSQNGGIVAGGHLGLQNINVQNFDGNGIECDAGGWIGFWGTITANNNNSSGIFVGQGGALGSDYQNVTLTANNNNYAGVNGVGGRLALWNVNCTGGQHGITLSSGASMWCGPLNVGAVTVPSQAIWIDSQSGLFNSQWGVTSGQWQTAAGQSFTATNMSLIMSGAAIAPANRAACSPAVNTIGNINSYILTQ